MYFNKFARCPLQCVRTVRHEDVETVRETDAFVVLSGAFDEPTMGKAIERKSIPLPKLGVKDVVIARCHADALANTTHWIYGNASKTVATPHTDQQATDNAPMASNPVPARSDSMPYAQVDQMQKPTQMQQDGTAHSGPTVLTQSVVERKNQQEEIRQPYKHQTKRTPCAASLVSTMPQVNVCVC